MATNKNALIRYQTLDRCFRNPGRRYFWEDLLEECNRSLYEFNGEQSGIRRRQLFEDIKYMESEAGWSVPLEKHREGRKVYYRYSDLTFSINNQPLNETEINQLQSGMVILSRFQGLPQLDWLQELIPRLQKGNSVESLAPVVSLDQNQYLKGVEHIGSLFNAIVYKKALEIEYQDFRSDAPYAIIFHPYHLKQFNNRWFVFGCNSTFDAPVWTMALDRIHNIGSSSDAFIENRSIDWEEYFEDIIGVTRLPDVPLERIQLWFHPTTAPYILTKPLHGSQKKISHDDSGLVIQLEIIPNFEFYQRILSFGEKVRVLSPKGIVEEIVGRLRNAVVNYVE